MLPILDWLLSHIIYTALFYPRESLGTACGCTPVVATPSCRLHFRPLPVVGPRSRWMEGAEQEMGHVAMHMVVMEQGCRGVGVVVETGA